MHGAEGATLHRLFYRWLRETVSDLHKCILVTEAVSFRLGQAVN